MTVQVGSILHRYFLLNPPFRSPRAAALRYSDTQIHYVASPPTYETNTVTFRETIRIIRVKILPVSTCQISSTFTLEKDTVLESAMLATAVAAAVSSGLAIRYLANQDEKHVLPSSGFTSDERVVMAQETNIADHPVLRTCASFRNKDGLIIRTKTWMPEGEDAPKAVLFLAHGFAEHCGRYEHVVNELLKLGLAVHALDHQGECLAVNIARAKGLSGS